MKTLMRTNRNLIPSIPSLLNDFFTDDWLDSSLANWRTSGASLPAVNVRETNNDFHIEVAAPGMKRDDFKVELDNNVLTISSHHEETREQEGQNDGKNNNDGTYSRREFSYQSFQRSFSLPEAKVEGDKIAARYVDGILHITVPKREEAKVKPAKQIKVA
jgi:HSP20 family protein